MCLVHVFLRRASRRRPVSIGRLVTCLGDLKVDTRHGAICSSVRALQGFKVSVLGQQRRPTNFCLTDQRFRLPRLELLISTMRSSEYVAGKGSQRLVEGLRDLTDICRSERLQQRKFTRGHVQAVGRGICCDVSVVRHTLARSERVSFRCYR